AAGRRKERAPAEGQSGAALCGKIRQQPPQDRLVRDVLDGRQGVGRGGKVLGGVRGRPYGRARSVLFARPVRRGGRGGRAFSVSRPFFGRRGSGRRGGGQR